MPYGLKRMLEIEAERKKRREEKARLKAEKEKQKKEEKKKIRTKKLKKKRNDKYYAKVKKARQAYHDATGDERGVFMIYFTKNRKRTKYLTYRAYKNDAIRLFYQMLEENNSKIRFRKKVFKSSRNAEPFIHELLLVKHLKPEDTDDPETLLRNEEGKFVRNVTDSDEHKILLKQEYYFEETFNVYGFDPIRDRKDFNYIYNNIILKKHNNYNRVFVYGDKLICHYDTDFDFIMCKTAEQAIDLYNEIEKQTIEDKVKHVLFMGKATKTTAAWIVDEMVEKTGWTRRKCQKVALK